MANLYVRSTNATADADNGSTWALAKTSLAGAAAIDGAGDRIYLSQAHAESLAAAQAITLAGSAASPVWLVAGNDALEPPQTVSTASLTTTGNNSYTVTGHVYAYGLTFNNGSGANSVILILASTGGEFQTYKSCAFKIPATGASARIQIGPTGLAEASRVLWHGCDVSFGATGQGFNCNSSWEWRGGSFLSGTSTPTILLRAPGRGARVLWDGIDLSQLGTTFGFVAADQMHASSYMFRNCKLPASWAGNLVNGTIEPACRVELWNCDSTDTNYRLWVEDYAGSIKSETTIVLSGGASDGTTPISWKMASAANAEYPLIVLRSPEFFAWVDSTGSALTATVEILYDGVTALTDADVWLEVEYLGTSGFPLGAFVDDCKADVLTNAANQTTSSATWSGVGSPTPLTQKLAATFTPQEKGVLICRVCLAKAGTTIYVNPKAAVA